MRTPPSPPTLSIARRVAAAHLDATLPCPVCAASLKAKNLDRHLAEVHEVGPVPDAPFPVRLELTGVDRRVFWVFLSMALLGALAVALAILALPAVGARLTLAGGLLPVALVALLVAALLPLVPTELGYLRARLLLDDRRVELRYALGLLRVEVTLPAKMETGSLWQSRQSADASAYDHSVAEDVRVGSYLRLSDASSAVTIASTGSNPLRKHWTSPKFQAGPRRRRWDITLDRESHVRLQYHLASLGLLEPA